MGVLCARMCVCRVHPASGLTNACRTTPVLRFVPGVHPQTEVESDGVTMIVGWIDRVGDRNWLSLIVVPACLLACWGRTDGRLRLDLFHGNGDGNLGWSTAACGGSRSSSGRRSRRGGSFLY